MEDVNIRPTRLGTISWRQGQYFEWANCQQTEARAIIKKYSQLLRDHSDPEIAEYDEETQNRWRKHIARYRWLLREGFLELDLEIHIDKENPVPPYEIPRRFTEHEDDYFWETSGEHLAGDSVNEHPFFKVIAGFVQRTGCIVQVRIDKCCRTNAIITFVQKDDVRDEQAYLRTIGGWINGWVHK